MAEPNDPAQALAQLRAEQERFVHAVSHDLRAPLRHIIAYGQLLHEELAAEPPDVATAQDYATVMAEAAQRLGRLIDGLVDWARLGQAPLAPVAVDMGALLLEARDALAAQFASRRIDWQEDQALPVLPGDPALLRSVWRELLDNALKFGARRDPLALRIGWQREGEAICFTVQDNGAGFNPAQAAQLFQPFTRLHSAKQFAGEGLGLARCQRILERHGGRIAAEAVAGAGCTVRFWLPG